MRDLNLPVQIEICPTVREPDGLAMSSRNALLTPDERERATALQPLSTARRQRWSPPARRTSDTILAAARAELDGARWSTEYFQIVNPDTLLPMTTIDAPALALVAARVGSTRLIDNQPLSTATSAAAHGSAQAAGSNSRRDRHVVAPLADRHAGGRVPPAGDAGDPRTSGSGSASRS